MPPPDFPRYKLLEIERLRLCNKISMAKNMTIDTLAQMTANEFRTVGKRLDTGESTMREGFAAVLEELQGLNDSVKQARGASNVESAGLRWTPLSRPACSQNKLGWCPQ